MSPFLKELVGGWVELLISQKMETQTTNIENIDFIIDVIECIIEQNCALWTEKIGAKKVEFSIHKGPQFGNL